MSLLMNYYGFIKSVIPASKARRESFLKKDSGQAGMTEKEDAGRFIGRG